MSQGAWDRSERTGSRRTTDAAGAGHGDLPRACGGPASTGDAQVGHIAGERRGSRDGGRRGVVVLVLDLDWSGRLGGGAEIEGGRSAAAGVGLAVGLKHVVGAGLRRPHAHAQPEQGREHGVEGGRHEGPILHPFVGGAKRPSRGRPRGPDRAGGPTSGGGGSAVEARGGVGLARSAVLRDRSYGRARSTQEGFDGARGRRPEGVLAAERRGGHGPWMPARKLRAAVASLFGSLIGVEQAVSVHR